MLLCGIIMSLEILDTATQGHGDRGPEKGSCGLKRIVSYCFYISLVCVRLMPEASSMNTCFFRHMRTFFMSFTRRQRHGAGLNAAVKCP